MNLSVTSPHSHAVSLAGASADSCSGEGAASRLLPRPERCPGSWLLDPQQTRALWLVVKALIPQAMPEEVSLCRPMPR